MDEVELGLLEKNEEKEKLSDEFRSQNDKLGLAILTNAKLIEKGIEVEAAKIYRDAPTKDHKFAIRINVFLDSHIDSGYVLEIAEIIKNAPNEEYLFFLSCAFATSRWLNVEFSVKVARLIVETQIQEIAGLMKELLDLVVVAPIEDLENFLYEGCKLLHLSPSYQNAYYVYQVFCDREINGIEKKIAYAKMMNKLTNPIQAEIVINILRNKSLAELGMNLEVGDRILVALNDLEPQFCNILLDIKDIDDVARVREK